MLDIPQNSIPGHPLDAPADLLPGIQVGKVVNVDEAIEKFGRDYVEMFAAHYSLGDEIGYRGYLAMRELGPKGWKMFENILQKGLENVEGVPEPLADFVEDYMTVPDYVDYEQLRRGAVAYWRAGKLMPMITSYAGISASFRNFGGTRPLLYSRLMLDDATSGRRLIETLRWVVSVTRPGGLEPGGEGVKLTARLRMIHATARYSMSRSDRWDWKNWGIPVDNADLISVTSIVFTRSIVDALTKIGVKLSAQEREDIYAMWRYISHLCGVPEEINFASEAEADRLGQVFRTMDYPADQGCRDIAHSLMRFMSNSPEGDGSFPAWAVKYLPPKGKLSLAYALIRFWAPPDVYKSLAIPRTAMGIVPRIMRPFVAAGDRLRRKSFAADLARAERIIATFDKAAKVPRGEQPLVTPDAVIAAFERNKNR